MFNFKSLVSSFSSNFGSPELVEARKEIARLKAAQAAEIKAEKEELSAKAAAEVETKVFQETAVSLVEAREALSLAAQRTDRAERRHKEAEYSASVARSALADLLQPKVSIEIEVEPVEAAKVVDWVEPHPLEKFFN